MATRTWSAASAGVWSNGANWSGGSKPATGDDVVFDGTSVQNCTVDETPANLNTITLTPAYTGAFAAGSFNFTIAGTVNISSTAALSAGGTWTQTGDANFTFITTSTTFTCMSMVIDLKGTGSLIYRASGGGIGELKCCYTGKTTTYALTGTGYIRNGLTLVSDGTLTIASGASLAMQTTTNDYTFNQGTATINGAGNFNFQNSNTGTLTIAYINFTGTGIVNIRISAAVSSIIEINGIVLSSASIYLYSTSTNGNQTINLNNSTITSAAGVVKLGASAAATSVTCNCGSATITASSVESTSYNAMAWNLNMQTSQWTVKGAWTFGSNVVVNPGAALVTFTTNDANITSSDKSFYDITLNEAAKTFTFIDDINILNDLTLIAGNFSNAGQDLTCGGDILFNGTGTLNLGESITLTGESSRLHFGNTIGAVTSLACAATFTGNTACVLNNDKDIFLKSLTSSNSSKLTITGSHPTRLYNTVGILLTIGTNCTFTTNSASALYLIAGSDSNLFTIGAGSVWNGSGEVHVRCPVGISADLSDLTYTGTGAWAIYDYGGAGTGIYNLTGNFSLGTAWLSILTVSAAANIIFNTENYNLTCGNMYYGSLGDGASVILNCGASAVIINAFESYSYAHTINFEASQWTCKGNWTANSNSTFNVGTASLTFNTAAGATITSAGKVYPIINAQIPLTINVGCTISRLIVTATKTITWQAGQTFVISNYTMRDWSDAIFVSSTPTTRYNLTVPVDRVRAVDLNIQDADASSGGKVFVLVDTGTIGNNCVNVENAVFAPNGAVFIIENKFNKTTHITNRYNIS